MSAFGLYVIGFAILLGGLGYGAYLLHVPQTWIIVGALIIVGIGVMSCRYPDQTPRSAERKRRPPLDRCVCTIDVFAC